MEHDPAEEAIAAPREDGWTVAHARGGARTKPDAPDPGEIPQLHEGARPGDAEDLTPVTEPAPALAPSGPRPAPLAPCGYILERQDED